MVEDSISLVRLLEIPTVSEQLIDLNLAICDEACTFRLDSSGEGPRADDGKLLAQHVRADIES